MSDMTHDVTTLDPRPSHAELMAALQSAMTHLEDAGCDGCALCQKERKILLDMVSDILWYHSPGFGSKEGCYTDGLDTGMCATVHIAAYTLRQLGAL